MRAEQQVGRWEMTTRRCPPGATYPSDEIEWRPMFGARWEVELYDREEGARSFHFGWFRWTARMYARWRVRGENRRSRIGETEETF